MPTKMALQKIPIKAPSLGLFIDKDGRHSHAPFARAYCDDH